MTWFLHWVPNLLLSTPFDLILSLCTQLTPFKNIWPDFIIVYPIDSFQDHLTWFYHCVPNWLLSRPFDLIYHCVHIWLFSRPFVLSLYTQLTHFKTIWPNFIIVYPIHSFQDHGLERSQFCEQCKKQVIWSWKKSIGYTMIKIGQMVLKGINLVHNRKLDHIVLKGVNWVHYDKIRWNSLERSQLGTLWSNYVIWSWKKSIGYTMIKLGQMVFKEVNWVHNDKIRSNGLERSQLGTQWYNWVKWSWKESIGYTVQKTGHKVFKGVNWVHNDKIRWNGLERSKMGAQYKNQFIWSWRESIGYSIK